VLEKVLLLRPEFATPLTRPHLLDALGWRGQFLRHRATQLGDSLSHLAPDIEVRLIGSGFALDLFASQLRLGLCRTEILEASSSLPI
jgi:hypothetical protein